MRDRGLAFLVAAGNNAGASALQKALVSAVSSIIKPADIANALGLKDDLLDAIKGKKIEVKSWKYILKNPAKPGFQAPITVTIFYNPDTKKFLMFCEGEISANTGPGNARGRDILAEPPFQRFRFMVRGSWDPDNSSVSITEQL